MNLDEIKSFDFYQKNKEYLRLNHFRIECYIAIDYVIQEELTEDDYNLIADKCIDAYLKYGDNDIELINIVDFITRGLDENNLELDELRELNSYDILHGYTNNSYDFGKRSPDTGMGL